MVEVNNVKNRYQDKYFVALGGNENPSDYNEINYRLYNDTYTVNINGKDHKARDCKVSKHPFNRPWPGHQRGFEQSESAAFISIYSDEPVLIRLKSGINFENPIIRPLSKKINITMENDEAIFELKEYGQYVFEPKDEHNALHIFYEKPKEFKNKDQATYYFGEGMHFPGVINLKDNESVYIDKNAIVFGSIYSDGAENIRIFGGGTIDNTCEERFTENCYEPYTKGTLKLYNCKNVNIEDVILTNSSTWVLAIFDSDSINIDNVKIVGHWRYNTDGIDITNTSNVCIKNSFIRSFDDTITIKGIYDNDKPIENIVIDNCVMWCGWGMNAELGLETKAPEYKNIIFKNCDLIHNTHVALDIQNGYGSDIHNIIYENINIEYQKETKEPILQNSSAESYPETYKTYMPKLISIHNIPFSARNKEDEHFQSPNFDKKGDSHNILYKNINVYIPEGLEKPVIFMQSVIPDITFKNIIIDGLSVNGVPQNDLNENFCVIYENTEPIKFI